MFLHVIWQFNNNNYSECLYLLFYYVMYYIVCNILCNNVLIVNILYFVFSVSIFHDFFLPLKYLNYYILF